MSGECFGNKNTHLGSSSQQTTAAKHHNVGPANKHVPVKRVPFANIDPDVPDLVSSDSSDDEESKNAMCMHFGKEKPVRKRFVSLDIECDINAEFNVEKALTGVNSSSSHYTNSSDAALIDSGASGHAAPSPDFLNNLKKQPPDDAPFYTASGEKLEVTHCGNIGEIDNVVCLPDLKSVIISVGQLCDQFRCRIIFDSDKIYLHHHNSDSASVVGWRQVSNGLYYLSLSQLRALRDVRNMRSQAGNGSGSELNLISPKSINKVNPLNLLHERCGHAGVTTILQELKMACFLTLRNS